MKHPGLLPAPLPLLLQGLIAELPREGGRWSHKEAEEWLVLASAAFDVLYDLADLHQVPRDFSA